MTETLLAFSDALARLVATAAPSVVAVQARRARASGIVWRPGLVVTADEALPDDLGADEAVSIGLLGGETVSARLAGRDPTTDVALLRFDGASPPPTVLAASGHPPAAGSLAVVVGAETGAPTAALGAVALAGPAWRSLRGGRIDARLELDLRLRRAAEGGLVLAADGRAVGMAVFGPRRRALVIPAATIERVAPALESRGRVGRGYLGLGLQPVRLNGEGRGEGSGAGEAMGAMVMSVAAGRPGAAAGLLMGDVIVAWDGAPVRRVAELVGSLGPESVGTTVRLSVRRAGEAREMTLTVGERPDA